VPCEADPNVGPILIKPTLEDFTWHKNHTHIYIFPMIPLQYLMCIGRKKVIIFFEMPFSLNFFLRYSLDTLGKTTQVLTCRVMLKCWVAHS
jgi:hypothetical protein